MLQNSGTLTVADGADLESNGVGQPQVVNQAGGTLTYPGGSNGATVNVPVVNDGAIQAQGGTLSLQSLATSASTATLSISISGSKSYGRLILSGTAALAGTLALHTASTYKPAIGATAVIVKAAKRTGTFSKITGTSLSSEHWSVIYSSTGVTLKAASG